MSVKDKLPHKGVRCGDGMYDYVGQVTSQSGGVGGVMVCTSR
jgi:hypothetical protein